MSHLCPRIYSLELFFQFRHHCQFELYIPRFIESLSLPPDQGPHPALLNIMYALACHFSPSSILSPHEPFFISRTIKALSHSLARADRLLHFIVASSLLARYYAFKGRLVETQACSGTNARFAYALGLHKIPSRIWKHNASNAHSSYATLLPPPKDSIELGERINAFWTLFVNDRAISLGTGLPCAMLDMVCIQAFSDSEEKPTSQRSIPDTLRTLKRHGQPQSKHLLQ